MAVDGEPLIRLEPGAQAPVVSYNLPEPAIYFGRNFIELDYEATVFGGSVALILEQVGDRKIDVIKKVRELTNLGLRDAKDLVENSPQVVRASMSLMEAERARELLEQAGATVRVVPSDEALQEDIDDPAERKTPAELVDAVREGMRSGFANHRLFPNVRIGSGSVRIAAGDDGPAVTVSTLPVGEQLAVLNPKEIAERKARGEELTVYRSLFGSLRYRFVARPRVPAPRILLVETYRLATYLGAYGAGPVVKTFTLLPGERTTISIRTFRKTEQERKEASSILDSFTEESATDFEEAIASEQTDRETYERSFAYDAEAEANARWGWGAARVKGGVQGGTNATREEAGKNTTNATNKHAQKASSKRSVEVDTSFEHRETEEEERTIEREIENINVSRTLNFVFRQMNQEFVTILSLVDIRVAYFDGLAESKDEVALADLDALLERHVVDDERDRVRNDVGDALGSILDHEGDMHQDFIEKREVGAGHTYLRVRSEKRSIYRDPDSQHEIEVPGIILSTTKNVMRTDGVIAEALVGTRSALDMYAERLQELDVERQEIELIKERAMAEREAIVNEAIRTNDRERAELLERVASEGSFDAPLELGVRPVRSADHGSDSTE